MKPNSDQVSRHQDPTLRSFRPHGIRRADHLHSRALLRNPLQVVRLIGGMLEKQYAHDDEVFDMINRINKNVVYMDKIVSDLQSLSKKRVPHLAEVKLNELFNNTLQTLTVPDGVEFKSGISDGYIVSVDGSMFERVLANLLNNAFQAMPDGGMMTPTILPFWASGQITGLLNGGVGAAEIEVLVKRPGDAVKLTDVYSFSNMLVFLIVGNIGFVMQKRKSG